MLRYRPLKEVAEELHVTPQTLRRRMNEAGITPYRPGRGPLLSDADVTLILEATRFRESDREETRKARGPITREELGERIRRGLAESRRSPAHRRIVELRKEAKAEEQRRAERRRPKRKERSGEPS